MNDRQSILTIYRHVEISKFCIHLTKEVLILFSGRIWFDKVIVPETYPKMVQIFLTRIINYWNLLGLWSTAPPKCFGKNVFILTIIFFDDIQI